MNYVIIGNSSAAIACIEAIRKKDKTNEIILVSDEPFNSYSRPVISYLLAEKADKKKMWYRAPDFYGKNCVKTMLDKKVTNINTDDKYIELSTGEKISFDKLLIATGGTPFIPPIKGLKKEGIFTFTKWADIEQIEKVINKIERVVVIGAGMIGTKATEAFVERGINVALVELADSVLCRALDKDAAEIVHKRMEEKGVEIFLNNEVIEICSQENKVDHVILRNKKEIKCDAVIIAIGVVPNTGIVKNTSINVNRGIVVDNNMLTNIKDIYAAGDVAEAEDWLQGGKKSIPIWPLAHRQGKIAGTNMTSTKEEYTDGFSMNSIEFCGISTISIGNTGAEGDEYEVIKKIDIEQGKYKKIIIKDNRIAGATFVGTVEKAGIINTLIKEKTNITHIKDELISDDFGYISFSRQFRKDRLEK